jgi:hypothetical protein
VEGCEAFSFFGPSFFGFFGSRPPLAISASLRAARGPRAHPSTSLSLAHALPTESCATSAEAVPCAGRG